MQERKLDVSPLVTVVKVKKGTPTVIEYEGRRYILEHKDQYQYRGR